MLSRAFSLRLAGSWWGCATGITYLGDASSNYEAPGRRIQGCKGVVLKMALCFWLAFWTLNSSAKASDLRKPPKTSTNCK
jgi:hypothetical protein